MSEFKIDQEVWCVEIGYNPPIFKGVITAIINTQDKDGLYTSYRIKTDLSIYFVSKVFRLEDTDEVLSYITNNWDKLI